MFNVKELLEQHGHEVIPFSVHSNKNVESEYSKYFVEPIGGRDVTYFNEVKKTPKTIYQLITRSIYSREVEKAITKEIEAEKPDLMYIIHFVNKLSPSVICAAKKKGLPVVMRLSDYHLLCPNFHFLYNKHICEECMTKGYKACVKKKCIKGSLFASIIRVVSMKVHYLFNMYKKVDAFVSPSLFLKCKMEENGFDDKQIEHIATFIKPFDEYEENIVGDYGLYIGRVSEEKGVEFIVKAYEKIPDHKLVIMGDDSTEEARILKAYIHDHNMSNIVFVGFKTGSEFKDILIKSRFTIIPSICYENLPNTALESFWYKKPILASNIGSLSEIVITGFNGILFDVGNLEQIVDGVLKMDDIELVKKYGDNCRKIVERTYSAEEHYNKLISLFSNQIIK